MSDEWSELRAAWRTAAAGASGPQGARVDVDALLARAHAAHRRSVLRRTATAVAALAVLLAAVAHAASPLEAVLALAIGLTVGATWIVGAVLERRESEALSQPATTYVERRLALLRAERRAIRYLWFVIALELVFLLPWWFEGIPLHLGRSTPALATLGVWAPVVALVALLAWTGRRARAVRRERLVLERGRVE